MQARHLRRTHHLLAGVARAGTERSNAWYSEASRAGNPRWVITLDGTKRYTTKVNGAVGFEVDNFRVGRQVVLTLEGEAVIGMEYV